jgi:hypothetical protein
MVNLLVEWAGRSLWQIRVGVHVEDSFHQSQLAYELAGTTGNQGEPTHCLHRVHCVVGRSNGGVCAYGRGVGVCVSAERGRGGAQGPQYSACCGMAASVKGKQGLLMSFGRGGKNKEHLCDGVARQTG